MLGPDIKLVYGPDNKIWNMDLILSWYMDLIRTVFGPDNDFIFSL